MTDLRHALIELLPSLRPAALASWSPEVHLDQRVLGPTFFLAFATLLFGRMPAGRTSRLDVSTMLKSEGLHPGKTPRRNVLVVAQLIAMVFLGIAALFVRGLLAGINCDFGVSGRDVLFAHLAPARPIARETDALLDDVKPTVTAGPEMRRVSSGNTVLSAGSPMRGRAPEDEKTGNADGRPVPGNAVDPEFFATFVIPTIFSCHPAPATKCPRHRYFPCAPISASPFAS